MEDVTNEIARTLTQQGYNKVKASNQWEALDVSRSLKTQTGQKLDDFETLRRQIRGGDTPSEIRAGEISREVIDNYLAGPRHNNSFVPDRRSSMRPISEPRICARQHRSAEAQRNGAGQLDVSDTKTAYGKDNAKTLRGKIESLETTKAGERELAGSDEGERTQLRDAMAGTIAERAGKALTNPKIYGLAGGTAGGGFGGVQQFAAGGFDPLLLVLPQRSPPAGCTARGAHCKPALGAALATTSTFCRRTSASFAARGGSVALRLRLRSAHNGD